MQPSSKRLGLVLVACLLLGGALPSLAEGDGDMGKERPATPAGKEDPKAPAKAPAVAKKSNIIPSAGEAALTNGIGDVLPSDECKADVKAFCKDQSAGEGRLAACLTKRLQAEKKGNVAGRQVSEDCVSELTEYKRDRNLNINRDIALARACKEDVAKICPKSSDVDEEGSVITCLREHPNKLSPQCSKEVLRTQLEAAEDYTLDAKLNAVCEDQVDSLCGDVEPGEGRELDCLTEKSKQLSWDCLDQVVRFQREAAYDIRLSSRLFKRCLNDQKKFCEDVEPGHARVQECLEDSMDDEEFSPGCRKELDAVIAKRVADFRLDPSLQEACKEDLETTCATTEADMKDETKRKTAINCLQAYKDELKSDECREKVHRKLKRASRDIRFDDVLASACSEDRKSYCNDVQPGSARVIRCLQDNRGSLSQQCTAALFDHEVKMAEDIDFKYPMRRSCAWEISTFCANVPHGHARIIRCLQTKLDHEDMSKECKDEVNRDQNRAATDFRLNWRLKHACEQDITSLCGGLCPASSNQPCGGVVLHCLSEKQDNITSPACQEEVFYYQLMEVSDFRNDVILAEACRDDVETYCKDVEPGEGRVHACLRHQINFISESCRAEENKLAALEYRDIRLKPKLAKLCSEERAVFCANVKPGKARVIKCLVEAMGKPNFGVECRQQLQERAKVVQSDYRYDVGVQQACAPHIDALCAEAKTKLRGNAAVLKCLVHGFGETSDECQAEMSRLVRFALWDYASGSPLTSVCDGDVDQFCPTNTANRPGGVFTIGAAGHCLSKALAEGGGLSPDCRELVLAAAPKESRAYLQYPEATNQLVQRVADLQRAAGLEGVLVDPYVREGSAVTITGWAALLCLVSMGVVAAGAAVLLFRRYTGVDKPHTQYVKSGDA
ncbi:MAG: hypothetical protein J3K34DRAFT_398918 [Monoraphidium minutum]|nr:MAG: hypothetical protein J3K34DRAFT_398918 [Monoraphidium minutum]